MAVPNSTFTEIVSTTLKNYRTTMADNVTNNNAILMRLQEKSRLQLEDGGEQLVEQIAFAENDTFQWYSGFDRFSTAINDTISAAVYDWKNAGVLFGISGEDRRKNSGSKTQIINLVDARLDVAEKTLKNRVATAMYSTGTGSGGKEIGGLQSIIADSPSTGTVGGIDAATYTFWRNISYDATTDGGAAATTANIQTYLNAVWVQVSRGTDQPDLYLADNNYYKLYLGSLQANQRFMSEKMAAAGFATIRYMNGDMVLDGGRSGGAPSNHVYFANTDYLKFRAHKDLFFSPISPDERASVDQDGYIKIIGLMGNLTCSCRFVQGVLKD